MKLIARWYGFNPDMNEPPDEMRFGNGTPATVDDYRRYFGCTARTVESESGYVEQVFDPDIVADVRFDRFAGHWAISGDGVEPEALFLNDPNASDDQIIAELFTLPVIYRTRIHR